MASPAAGLRVRAGRIAVLIAACAFVLAGAASAVTIDWVPIGDPGNPPVVGQNGVCGAADCGSVAYDYSISKYEVTNTQYAEFLNAKAAADPLGLYNASVETDATNGGITRAGTSGSYTYAVKAGFENKPVNYVSFFDALRFSNWLDNGQGDGDTETGAYTLLGGTATPSNASTVTRNAGAHVALPSENEWFKAAYYSPGGVYFLYPAGSDTTIGCSMPTAMANNANCNFAVGALVDVGSYPGSASPYGTFDQGGNAYEWNEQIYQQGASRGVRGGSFDRSAGEEAANNPNLADPMSENDIIGFRVAMAPETSNGLLGIASWLGLAVAGRRHAQHGRPR